MNLDHQYIKGCAGKKQHQTLLAAEVYLDEKHHNTGAEIYNCQHCGFFHIGSPHGATKKVNYKQKFYGDDKYQHKNKFKRFKY